MISQIDLIDMCRILHSTTSEFVFSRAHKTFGSVNHMLGHKMSLKSDKTENISRSFSNHNGMKLKSNGRKQKNSTINRNQTIYSWTTIDQRKKSKVK